jgi:hypothetical protein
MKTGVIWQTMYLFPTPVLALLAIVLVRRRLLPEFPFFFSYVMVACLRDVADFAAMHASADTWQKTYWYSHLISTGFMLFATCELFTKRLFPRFYKVSFYRYLFSVAALAILALSTFNAREGINTAWFVGPILVLDCLRVVALLFFVALMVFMGRQWSRYEFGIALGLSIDSAIFLITLAVVLKSRYLPPILRQVPALTYDMVCLVWLITFLRPEPPKVSVTEVSPKLLSEAKKWEGTLKDSLIGKK